MKPRHLMHLHNLDTQLADIASRWECALQRLSDAQPVFSSKTSGNGDPPGGHGGGAGPGSLTSVERLADRAFPHGDRPGRRPSEIVDLEQLQAFPCDLTRRVHVLLDAVGHVAAGVSLPSYGPDPSRRFEWARWAVGQLRAAAMVIELDTDGARALARLRRLVDDRHSVVGYWGATIVQPKLPKLSTLDELADDPTENWCRSCLRVGVRSARYRGDLCRWCYEFHGTERMLPPAEIIVARAEGKRITESMVKPHRPVKKKKRRARK